MADGLAWAEAAPSPEDYVALRAAAGLAARSLEAARAGLPRTLHAVSAREGGRLVAMGRVLGDGGCFALITDVAVAPDRQGRGLGRAVMDRLDAWCDAHLPPGCHVGLIASPRAERLYAARGYDRQIGMDRHVGGAPRG